MKEILLFSPHCKSSYRSSCGKTEVYFICKFGVLALVFRVICHSQNRKFRQAKKLYSFY